MPRWDITRNRQMSRRNPDNTEQSGNSVAGSSPDAPSPHCAAEGPALFRQAVTAWEKADLPRTVNLLRRAVALCPEAAEYRQALGELLIEQNQYEEAVSVFETLIAGNPSMPVYHFHCGVALERSGHPNRSAGHFLRASQLDPQWEQAHFNAGTLLHRLNRLEDARLAFESCLRINPNQDAAWINLGNVLDDSNKPEEAYHCWRQALVLCPDNSLAHYNIGTYYQSRDRLSEAVEAYEQALRCDPGRAKPYLNMALCFRRLGNAFRAIESLQKAVAVDPGYGLAWYNLASVHREHGDTDSAIACYQKVVALEPENDAAWYNLAVSLRKKERIADAMAACGRALKITPHFAEARAYLFQLSQHACDWDLADRLRPDLDRQTADQLSQNRKPAESPMLSLRRDADPEKNARIATAWSHWISLEIEDKKLFQCPDTGPAGKENRRMRIGYLSADVKDHAVAHQIRGMLAAHDRTKFEIFCYACNPPDNSDYAGHIRNACDRFTGLHALDDTQAARQIHRDGIDILVDMMGHTRGGRPAIAGLRPRAGSGQLPGVSGNHRLRLHGLLHLRCACRAAGTRCFLYRKTGLPSRMLPGERRPHADGRKPVQPGTMRFARTSHRFLQFQPAVQNRPPPFPGLDEHPATRSPQCAVAAGPE